MGSWENSQESVVYGCIKDVAFEKDNDRRLTNRNAVLALPNQEGLPLLNREMFSVPSLDIGPSGQHTQVLHFGSSYRGVEYEWTQWLERFEALLRSMYWVSASIHLETDISGTHAFAWEASGDYHTPNSDDIQIRCEWTHEGWLSR